MRACEDLLFWHRTVDEPGADGEPAGDAELVADRSSHIEAVAIPLVEHGDEARLVGFPPTGQEVPVELGRARRRRRIRSTKTARGAGRAGSKAGVLW